MASSESPAMKREREIVAELAVHNENLGTVRDEMNALSDRLRELRAQEGAIQDVIMQLEFEKRHLHRMDVQQQKKKLVSDLDARESEVQRLQAALERAMNEKEVMHQQLGKLDEYERMDAAGKKQETWNTPSSRYDMASSSAKSGLSGDPLNQTPAHLAHTFRAGVPHEHSARSIDDIGQHQTASPLVKAEDFVITGERPQAPSGSAKFKDFRQQVRTSTRVAQPPGGHTTANVYG